MEPFVLVFILTILVIAFLYFITNLSIAKESIEVDKKEKQKREKKEESIEKCASCVFLNYIDPYWAQCIICYKLGQFYPPYACSYYKNKNEYNITITDNKYKLTKKNKMVSTEKSV